MCCVWENRSIEAPNAALRVFADGSLLRCERIPAPNVAWSIPQAEQQQQQDPKPNPPNRLLLVRIRRLLLMNSPWPKYQADLANTGVAHSF